MTGERGSGTLLVAVVAALVLAVAVGVVVVSSYAIAIHRARAGADLSALSGATAVARDGDGCPVAAAVAESNEVRLVSCELSGDDSEFVVSVRVEVRVGVLWPGLPDVVSARAHAGRVDL